MPAAHGTLIRARTGCPCTACQHAATATYRRTPRGVKPLIERKFGVAKVIIDPSADLDALVITTEKDLDEQVHVSGVCNPETWDDLMDSDVNVGRAQTAIAEAVLDVPTTRKVEVDPSRYRKGAGKDSRTVNPGEDPRQPLDLPVLIAQMRVLSTGLLTGETDVGVAMKAYGRLRDEIARRRHEFAEAEGVFDVLQRAILSKVSEP
jgi:hypothetical protein